MADVKAKGTAVAKAAPAPAKPRVTPGEFVRQVRAEFAKISWPTTAETVRMTIMVMIMTGLLSLFFLGVDQVIGRLVKLLLSFTA